jgi:HSP20 family protein
MSKFPSAQHSKHQRREEKRRRRPGQGLLSERVYGAFFRSLPLPAEINPKKVQATFKNGVLEIRLPKSEQAKRKQITVNVDG